MTSRLHHDISSGHFAELDNGISLHYACAGEQGKPLLLMLHGFPEFWYAWHELMPALSDQFFVVAPDMRGFNLSSKPAEVDKYRIELLTQDIALLISNLGYDKATVVAHDWGGAVAYALAISMPALIDKLVILNAPHPVEFARSLANNVAQQNASRYMNDLRRSDAELVMLAENCARLQGIFRAPGKDAWVADDIMATYRAAWLVPGAMTGALNYYRATPIFPAQGREAGANALELDEKRFVVNVPTRVIWGMQDSALLPDLLDNLPRHIPDLDIIRIAGGSHWLIHEFPELILEHIVSFVAD